MMENWLNPRSGISAVITVGTFIYLYNFFFFFFAWLHYYKFSRIGWPVLGRYISVNKENVSLSLSPIHT